MAAQDFLLDSQVQAWLDGLEPAWTLLTFESLQALRHEPAATRTAIRIANDLSCDEIAGSPIARNTLILLRAAIAHAASATRQSGNKRGVPSLSVIENHAPEVSIDGPETPGHPPAALAGKTRRHRRAPVNDALPRVPCPFRQSNREIREQFQRT
jgi:hypothetical protein